MKITRAFETQEGLLSASEAEFLSGIYREAMRGVDAEPDQADVDRAVARLAMMYRWGLRDRDMLMRAARVLSNPAEEHTEE